MVRFSDMLGGSSDADEPSADTAPTAARELPHEGEESPDPDAPPVRGTVQFVDQVGAVPPPAAPVADPAATPRGPQSPQDVLDRLTQYASSARAADEAAPAPDPPAAEPVPPQPPAATREPDPPPPAANTEKPGGDDLLPRAKRTLRKPGRGDKRRP
jgi:hypothetical protein